MNKLLALIVLIAASCKTTDIESSIQIVNNSNAAISTFLALPSDVGFAYPDTILPMAEIAMQVAAPSQLNFYDFGFSIDELFDFLPNDTISVYYFSTETLNNNTWEEIRESYMVLRRDDLVRPTDGSNYWLIEYP